MFVAFFNHNQRLLNLNIRRIQDVIEVGNQTVCIKILIIEYSCRVAVIFCTNVLLGDTGSCDGAAAVTLRGARGFLFSNHCS